MAENSVPDPVVPASAEPEPNHEPGLNDDGPETNLVADIHSLLRTELPDLERREVIRTIETVVRERSFLFYGPPPEVLAEYERIHPGWSKHLLEQENREQTSRLDRDRESMAQTRLIVEAEARNLRDGRSIEARGQVLGFLAFLIVAAIGTWALYLGQIAVAITCFTTFALTVVGLFIAGRGGKSSSGEK